MMKYKKWTIAGEAKLKKYKSDVLAWSLSYPGAHCSHESPVYPGGHRHCSTKAATSLPLADTVSSFMDEISVATVDSSPNWALKSNLAISISNKEVDIIKHFKVSKGVKIETSSDPHLAEWRWNWNFNSFESSFVLVECCFQKQPLSSLNAHSITSSKKTEIV